MAIDLKASLARPEAEERAPLVIPPPTIPQRLLDEKALTARTFPSGPKRLWKAAREAGHAVRATYSVGPWMSANFQAILERECPTIAIWVVKPDRTRVRALWINRGGKWTFEHAWLLGIPLPQRLNSKEMTAWI